MVFPLNLQVVPIAVAYMIVGRTIRKVFGVMEFNTTSKWFVIVLSFLCISVVFCYREYLWLDLKYNNIQSMPISLLISVLVVMIIGYNCILFQNISFVSVPLACIGEASMIIMFLHQFINTVSHGYSLVALTLGILLPTAIYYVIKRHRILSFIFLGKK